MGTRAFFLTAALAMAVPACGGRTLEDDLGQPGSSGTGRSPFVPCPDLPRAPGDRAPSAEVELAQGSVIGAVAVDDSNVYFSSAPYSYGSTMISAVPKTGGPTRVLSEGMVYQLATGVPGSLYLGGGGGPLYTMPSAGGDVTQLPVPSAFQFTLTQGSLIYTDLETNAVYRAELDGRNRVVVGQGKAPQGVSVYGGYVYWANYGDKSVARAPLAGGAPEVLHTFGDFTREVVADCRYAYVSVGNYGDSVYRIPLTGGEPEFFASVGGSLVLDTHGLYVENSAGAYRVSLVTGAMTRLGDGFGRGGGYPQPLTVDDEAVYWSAGSRVLRMTK